MSEIITTSLYWDCECEDNYIHPKSHSGCMLCLTKADEQPDSRVEEVIEWIDKRDDILPWQKTEKILEIMNDIF